MIDCRKNVYALTPAEWNAFATAVNMLKSSGEYEDFVKRHYVVRTAAHRGPAFLPWHRYYIREFELLLQTKVAGVTLPYWNWADDLGDDPANPLDPTQGAIWNTAAGSPVYVGGDGDSANDDKVVTGPFAGWTIHEGSMGNPLPPNPTTRPMQDVLDDLDTLGIFSAFDGIRRTLGNSFGPTTPFFPTQAQIDSAIADYDVYDTSPWTAGSAASFRNRIEGWLTEPGEQAEQLHNRAHTWIGGSMLPPTSPNDPVFFLHHCNIDRIWATWQRAHPAAGYLPVSGGPAGHNLADTMPFLRTPGATPAGCLDYARDLGYMYDTDLPFPQLETPALQFADVPEGTATTRAVVFGILDGCRDKTLDFELVGSLPAPFSAPFGTVVTYDPATTLDDRARLFIAYEGTVAGATHTASVEVRCIQLGTLETITINANTIAKPSVACALVLDRSGSMLADAGLGNGKRRVDVLQEAAPTLVDLLHNEDGIGLASFNHDGSIDMPLAVAGPPSGLPLVGPRGQAKGSIAALAPGGATSIADGIIRGQELLANGPDGFDEHTVVVFTDGHENSAQFLADISGQIDARVFAIGLGRPEVLQPARLEDIADNTDGYLMLTGDTAVDTLRLQKYFVQILSGVENTEIVLDPQGRVRPGRATKIEVQLHPRDTAADFIVLAPAGDLFEVEIVAPSGLAIDAALASAGVPGIERIEGERLQAFRLQLPLITPAGEGRAGKWTLVLSLSEARFEKYLGTIESDRHERRLARSGGAPFVAVVRARSGLSLRVRSRLESREPGATAQLRVSLTELGQPFRGRAQGFVEVVDPKGREDVLRLEASGAGRWRGELATDASGVYTARVRVEGIAADRRPFTREQLLTLSVWNGGDREPFEGREPPVPKEERSTTDEGDRPREDRDVQVRDPRRDVRSLALSTALRARLFDMIVATDQPDDDRQR